jgi:hypothetical protein
MRRIVMVTAVLVPASLWAAGQETAPPSPTATPSPAASPAPATSPSGSPRPALTGRPSAPQPLQKQSLDYFVGRWSFKWTGRESALSPGGVVEGTMSLTALGASGFLEGRPEAKGKPGPLGERVLLGFDEEKKSLVLLEQRGPGLEVLALGDWTSPVAIRFKAAPLQVRGQTLHLKLTVSVVAGHSFTLAEELSEDGGPFQRLGNAVFSKLPTDAKATPAR